LTVYFSSDEFTGSSLFETFVYVVALEGFI